MSSVYHSSLQTNRIKTTKKSMQTPTVYQRLDTQTLKIITLINTEKTSITVSVVDISENQYSSNPGDEILITPPHHRCLEDEECLAGCSATQGASVSSALPSPSAEHGSASSSSSP